MITKTQTAISLFQNGEEAKALSIFKTFKLGLTKDERDTLTIAHEITAGKSDFYESLGYDSDEVLTKAREIIKLKYLRECQK